MSVRPTRCRTVRNMLPLHVGGDLDPRHVGAVDAHLGECLSCFREFRELAALRGRLGVLAEEPLPTGILDGFTDEVMARIQVGEPGPAAAPPGRVVRGPWWSRLSAAAAAILVTVAAFKVFDDPGVVPDLRPPVVGGTREAAGEGEAVDAPGTTGARRREQLRASLGSIDAGGSVRAPSPEAAGRSSTHTHPTGVVVPFGRLPGAQQQVLLQQGGVPVVPSLCETGADGLEIDPDHEPRERRP